MQLYRIVVTSGVKQIVFEMPSERRPTNAEASDYFMHSPELKSELEGVGLLSFMISSIKEA